MGGYLSGGPPPETPITSFIPRIKNIAVRNWRGLLSVVAIIVLFAAFFDQHEVKSRTILLYLLMFWFFLTQPVFIPVTGLLPIPAAPMLSILDTNSVCKNYFGNAAALFVVGGWIGMLLNNSGMDRRIMLKILSSGSNSPANLIVKSSIASFLLSALSNRLLVTEQMMEILSGPLINLQSSTARTRATEPSYNSLRYLVCTAIQTSASLGGLAIMHSSYCNLAFLAVYSKTKEVPANLKTLKLPEFYQDTFNYLSYSGFALPTAILMFICNLIYLLILCKIVMKKQMSPGSMGTITDEIKKAKSKIPKSVTLHEKLSVFFLILFFLLLFTRSSGLLGDMGWASFTKKNGVPQLLDSAPCGAFAILLHILTKGYGYLKYFSPMKKSQLPPAKPESAIIFWKFVDKNTNYAYLLLFGSGAVLSKLLEKSGLALEEIPDMFSSTTSKSFFMGVSEIIGISAILANAMTSVAALIMILPLVLHMGGPQVWRENNQVACLGVNLGCNLGFCSPFRFTPAYFCKKTAKMPYDKQFKYGVGCMIICTQVSSLLLAVLGPALIPAPTPTIVITTTTPPP